jgi:hypothetical protein
VRTTAVLSAATLLLTAGCGGSGTSSETPTAPPRPTSLTLTVFKVRVGVLRPIVVHVPRSQPATTGALRALGVVSPVTISNGTAAVRLRKASDETVAGVVYTLTQFPEVRRVDIAGRKGLTRDDFAAYLPPISVESPAPGASVRPTFHVRGTASVFEATLVVQTIRNGVVLERRTVTATEGAPGRGTFDTTLYASPGRLVVRAFAPSAKDGSAQHEVDVDVVVRG